MEHPGFHGAEMAIAARQHIPMANAGAILGAAAHKASPAAIRKNPRLEKVGGIGKFHKAYLARKGAGNTTGAY